MKSLRRRFGLPGMTWSAGLVLAVACATACGGDDNNVAGGTAGEGGSASGAGGKASTAVPEQAAHPAMVPQAPGWPERPAVATGALQPARVAAARAAAVMVVMLGRRGQRREGWGGNGGTAGGTNDSGADARDGSGGTSPSDGGSEAEAGPSLTISNYLNAIANAWCDRMAECCNLDAAHFDKAKCVGAASLSGPSG